MRKFLLILVLAVFLIACDDNKRSTPQPPRPPAPAPSSEVPAASPDVPNAVVLPTPPAGVLNPGPGPTPFPKEQQAVLSSSSDVGEAINLAQKLGGIKEVVLDQSCRIETPVILQPGIRLRLNDGVVVTTHTEGIPIRLKEGASIVGAGMNKSGIVESSVKGQWVVIAGYYGTESNGAPDFDLLLHGFQVKGSDERGTDFNSAPQAVALGNCKRCHAEDLWINGTHSIGLQVGGGGVHFTPSGQVRQFADSVKVVHCKFSRVASQSLALVNGQDIEFAYNWIDSPGQLGGPGSHPIDLEINQIEDRLQRVKIHHNFIDSRQGLVFGNGIIVQAGEKIEEIDDIEVTDNVLIGGNLQPATNVMSNGIYVFGPAMKHVTVRSNRVWRTGQACFNVNGAGIVVTDNECVSTGGGGIPGAIAEHVRNSAQRRSEISRNTFRALGDGSADGRLQITDSPELILGDNPGFGVERK